MQAAVGIIPLALTIYALVFGRNPAAGTRAGFPLIQYLSLAGLLVLVFTTLWFYRYTRLAARIADPQRRPDESALRAPQAGIPVIQTTSGGPASWVSAADIAGLMALLLTMFVEVAVLAFSLWLLYRTTSPSVEFPYASGRVSDP
jgi:hypothetical protein